MTAVAAVAAAVYLHRVRKLRQTDAERLAAWGQPKDRDPDLGVIGSYHFFLAQQADAPPSLDARTWADLDLDAVFGRLDRTESAPGRQVLYHRLRTTAHSPASLAAFDDLAVRFGDDVSFRLRAQRMLASLGGQSVYWLWSLAIEPVALLPRWAVVYPLFAGLMLVSIVLIPFVPVLLPVPVLGFLVGSVLRARLGLRLVPLADSFRDMVRLLLVAERFEGADALPSELRRDLHARLANLARLRRVGGWLGRDATGDITLLGIFIEYWNLMFCLDANAVMLCVRELRRRQADLHAVFESIGTLDAALAVASVRAGHSRWKRPIFDEPLAQVVFDDLRHPLLDDAVPNSLRLGPPDGVLVTGANMTGKSTFLRTVGVNVVLAQTVHTVFAASYKAPWLSVASCITAGDDLQAGKSSYQAEVEALVAMLKGLIDKDSGDRLFLFDELFRGTNTLDRIGAASAVLRWLVDRSRGTGVPPVGVNGPRCLVMAATHDLELVSLLAGWYDVGHFADRLGESGLQFDYRWRPGPTTTRNAIALLGVLGAPAEVVSDALARADLLRARAN